MKKISVLGSTGSIGTQCLEIVEKYGFEVEALTAHKNIKLLEQQARKFNPKFVAVFDEEKANELKLALADTSVKVYGGESGILAAAETGSEIVLNSIVGIAGLKPSLTAINSGSTLALANKETMVAGGNLVTDAAKRMGKEILPVDSEHSAIFQSLIKEKDRKFEKIILTASGGPFYGKTRDELKNITPADALKHPNWDMGQKITIDSATLMNKGLEVIEAVHLFGCKASDIEVVVHRQSILHSAVEFCDGAVIGQMGTPDMKIPIQLALTYPERYESDAPKLSLTDIGTLTFAKPDMETFTCLKTCIDAINKGGLKPAAANGANEMAVELFLKGKIGFLDIGELVAFATENQKDVDSFTLEDVFEADKQARSAVLSRVNNA